jgi:uncharacterized protein YneR
MKKNLFKIILLLTLLNGFQMIKAQIYVGAGTGIYSISENLDNIEISNSFGYSVKVGYMHNLNSKFSLGIGVEVSQSFQEATAVNDFSYNTFLVDDTRSAFEHRLVTKGYVENQTLTAIQVPIFVQYKRPITEKLSIYARAGVKHVLPQKFSAAATADQIKVSGYYPDFNLLIEDLPSRGFGTQNGFDKSIDYEKKYFIMSSFEIGLTFKMRPKNSIYIGFFADNALSNLVNNNIDDSFIGYSPNGISESQLNGVFSTKKNAEIRPNNYGLTFFYTFE